MKIRLQVFFLLFGISSSVYAQDFIQGQPGGNEPAPGNRVSRVSGTHVEKRVKTATEIESEVIRYLALQLTSDSVSDDLKAFLAIDERQVGDILSIIQPIEDHFMDLELQRLQAMCESLTRVRSGASAIEKVDQSLDAYRLKFSQQREEPPTMYQQTIEDIGKVIGSVNADAWSEYLLLQRKRMARANTSYFHENVGSDTNSLASIESNCGGVSK